MYSFNSSAILVQILADIAMGVFLGTLSAFVIVVLRKLH